MSKRVKKGKNAQKKKQQKVTNSSSRSSTTSVAQQRLLYEEEVPPAELGEGVRARAKGTTMSLGVRILVGVMAFAMLTMMGVVSYSSMNNFDIIQWLTGEDVAPGTASPTSSKSAFTKQQRAAMDATNQFDGFFVVDEEAGITLTAVNSDLQDDKTAPVTKKYKEEAESRREEILAQDEERIAHLEERKTAREDAKQNSPFNKFTNGLGQFRDAVVALFTNTYDGLTGNNRAEETLPGETYADGNLTDVDSDTTLDYNVESDAATGDAADLKATAEVADTGTEAETATAAGTDTTAAASDGDKSLNEVLAETNGLATSSSTDVNPLLQGANGNGIE